VKEREGKRNLCLRGGGKDFARNSSLVLEGGAGILLSNNIG
jgi:hypothetical protein